ncbi:hypothetical protein [Spirosoma flavus]
MKIILIACLLSVVATFGYAQPPIFRLSAKNSCGNWPAWPVTGKAKLPVSPANRATSSYSTH